MMRRMLMILMMMMIVIMMIIIMIVEGKVESIVKDNADYFSLSKILNLSNLIKF
jgi:hypothetical protein